MTTDPWQHMLLAIEPAYFEYKDAIERGPKFVPLITQGPSILHPWEFKIDEQWPDGVNYGTHDSGVELARRCMWCEYHLDKWSDVIQWDQTRWLFKNRHDAEKFITFYYLRWQ